MPWAGSGRRCCCNEPDVCVEGAAPEFRVQTNIPPENHFVVVSLNEPCEGPITDALLWCTSLGNYTRQSPGTAISIESESIGTDPDFENCEIFRVTRVTVGSSTYDYETGDYTRPDGCVECINLQVSDDSYTRRRFLVGTQPASIQLDLAIDLNDPNCDGILINPSTTANFGTATIIDGWIVAGSYNVGLGVGGGGATMRWQVYGPCMCEPPPTGDCGTGTDHDVPYAWLVQSAGGTVIGSSWAEWVWVGPDTPISINDLIDLGQFIGIPVLCCEPQRPVQCEFKLSFDL